MLACALPVVLGFVVPALSLSRGVWLTAHEWVDARFFDYALNSFILAIVAASLAVVIAVLLAYALRLRRSPVTLAAARVASMGYAIPGTVIAVGVMLPLAWIDNSVDAWMRATFGISTGLIFSGTIYAVVSAYLVRFLAIAFQSVEAGLARITSSMDDAARSLGAGPAATLARVHAPMLWTSLLGAGLLVFVDVMKELPATFAMRPFNFDTLAVEIYNLTKDERLGEAAAPSLVIVAISMIPLIVLSRQMGRSTADRHD